MTAKSPQQLKTEDQPPARKPDAARRALEDRDHDHEAARKARDRVTLASMDSFPASDPPGYYTSTS